MFSAMPKAKCKNGVAARPANVRRTARSVRAPARLAEDAAPVAPGDDSSGDDGGLHRQIAELQAQLRSATARPDGATARPDAATARTDAAAALLDAATASTSVLDTDVTELPSMSAALVPGAHSLRQHPKTCSPIFSTT